MVKLAAVVGVMMRMQLLMLVEEAGEAGREVVRFIAEPVLLRSLLNVNSRITEQ